MSFRVSWLVAPVTKTLPLNSRASGAAFEFVAAAQCHRGEQGQMNYTRCSANHQHQYWVAPRILVLVLYRKQSNFALV